MIERLIDSQLIQTELSSLVSQVARIVWTDDEKQPSRDSQDNEDRNRTEPSQFLERRSLSLLKSSLNVPNGSRQVDWKRVELVGLVEA